LLVETAVVFFLGVTGVFRGEQQVTVFAELYVMRVSTYLRLRSILQFILEPMCSVREVNPGICELIKQEINEFHLVVWKTLLHNDSVIYQACVIVCLVIVITQSWLIIRYSVV